MIFCIEYQILIVPLTKRTSLSPLSFPSTTIEYQLATHLWAYFWPLSYISLLGISILTLTSSWLLYLYSKLWYEVATLTFQLCSWFSILLFYPVFIFFFLFFNFIFKLYNIVLVLPNIEMNLPQVYMCSPSWTLLPPLSPFHPSGSSQCTSPKHPVSCIKPGLSCLYFHIDLTIKLSIKKNH